jgi:hypothetical protein
MLQPAGRQVGWEVSAYSGGQFPVTPDTDALIHGSTVRRRLL